MAGLLPRRWEAYSFSGFALLSSWILTATKAAVGITAHMKMKMLKNLNIAANNNTGIKMPLMLLKLASILYAKLFIVVLLNSATTLPLRREKIRANAV